MFDSGELLSVIEPPEWVVDDEVVDELDELNELDAVDGFIGCSKRQTSPDLKTGLGGDLTPGLKVIVIQIPMFPSGMIVANF